MQYVTCSNDSGVLVLQNKEDHQDFTVALDAIKFAVQENPEQFELAAHVYETCYGEDPREE